MARPASKQTSVKAKKPPQENRSGGGGRLINDAWLHQTAVPHTRLDEDWNDSDSLKPYSVSMGLFSNSRPSGVKADFRGGQDFRRCLNLRPRLAGKVMHNGS
jgi:hypothetical protein